MKKILAMLVLLVVVSCGADTKKSEGGSLEVALLLNGPLGDKSFFDSANNGMTLIKEKYPDIKTRVVEIGQDRNKWEPALIDLSEQSWDIIIVGTWQIKEILESVAVQYPEKKYIIFDSSVEYDKGIYGNIYSIEYKQNEGAFLGGALAAMLAAQDSPYTSQAKNHMGFVGGMEIPVINDFLVGYIAGGKHVNPDIKVDATYIGDFINAAKAKELGLTLYNRGASIIFGVGAPASLGVIDASIELNRLTLGVDSDQATFFEATAPEKSKLIASSVIKSIDVSLLRAITLELEGELPWGSREVLGLKESSVKLADNKYFRELTDESMRETLAKVEQDILSGKIVVPSMYEMTVDELNAMKNSVRP